MANNFTHAARDQQQSRLLALPAELRLEIFELTFADDEDLHGLADMMSIKPPSGTILRTCQQAYRESRQAYKASYRGYWAKTFTADLAHNFVPQAALFSSISVMDLAHIKHFEITTELCGAHCTVFLDYSDDRGLWRVRIALNKQTQKLMRACTALGEAICNVLSRPTPLSIGDAGFKENSERRFRFSQVFEKAQMVAMLSDLGR